MTTKRVGRLFFYTTDAGHDCVVNLDAIACTSRHREGGTVHGRLISGVHRPACWARAQRAHGRGVRRW